METPKCYLRFPSIKRNHIYSQIPEIHVWSFVYKLSYFKGNEKGPT